MDSKDYKTSKNYDLLVDLLNQQKRVICFVDYDARSGYPCRDTALARSFKSKLKENEMCYEAGVRGIGYLYGFAAKCLSRASSSSWPRNEIICKTDSSTCSIFGRAE